MDTRNRIAGNKPSRKWICPSRRALILVLLTVLLTACAGPGGKKEAPASTRSTVPETAPRYSVYEWTVIDSSPAGNVITGKSGKKLVRPVAVAARGNQLYIVDAGQQRLFRYHQSEGRLEQLRDLKGVTKGEITDIYLASDLSYYLADNEGQVLHYDSKGRLVKRIREPAVLGRPMSISADESSGRIYVADGFNDDVLVYDHAGKQVDSFGERGQGEARFMGITAHTRGPKGHYVASRFGKERVQVLDDEGAYVSSFQQDTVTFPTSIVVDVDNRAFVSDYFDNTIKVYVNGRQVDTLGKNGSKPGEFRRITDLWLDDGLLYVADSLNGRVQILRVVIGMSPDSAR